MYKNTLLTEFTKKFKSRADSDTKGIGIECELPIVNQEGEAASLRVIYGLFDYLATTGFELKVDKYTQKPIAATRINLESALQFGYGVDTIATDLGFSTLEIALAPQANLCEIQTQLAAIIQLLLPYFERHQCRILGYGIQPITPPSTDLLVPHKRYNFIDRVSGNHFVPASDGKDFHLLTVTASNQCHIDVSLEEAIPAVNVLNGLSGLQIALQANSPIWKGEVDHNYKATRELFWDYCFPDRIHQAGIPAKFNDLAEYVANLMSFKAQRVIRNGKAYRIAVDQTFKDFYQETQPTIGVSREGDCLLLTPQPEDIHLQNGFCYYNARLVSKFGTIENRMCCQQPPGETMVTAALTLGILENLSEAQQLLAALNFITPKDLRMEAIKNGLATKLAGKSIIPWGYQLLAIAEKGLQKRGDGEEIFLAPLFERLEKRQTPADLAIAIFQKEGVEAFLETFSFKTAKLESQAEITDNNYESSIIA